MISYKEYKLLMETVAPTVSLGVTTPKSQISGRFGFTPVDATEEVDELLQSLEEAKKKMFGDEIVDSKNAPPKDSDLDAEEDAEEDSVDNDEDVEDSDCKKCKKSKKESVEEFKKILGEAKKMAKMKKCGGEMGMSLDKIKGKKDDDEEVDDEEVDVDIDVDDDEDMSDEDLEMMKKSKKEQAEFLTSLTNQLKGTKKINRDGISEYLEDAVFVPSNYNSNLVTDSPGEVGFAPQGRLGVMGSEEQQSLSSNFMNDWQVIKDLALGKRQNGLQDG